MEKGNALRQDAVKSRFFGMVAKGYWKSQLRIDDRGVRHGGGIEMALEGVDLLGSLLWHRL